MMAPFIETVPHYLETYVECLGDLAWYSMAVEQHAFETGKLGAVPLEPGTIKLPLQESRRWEPRSNVPRCLWRKIILLSMPRPNH